MSGLRARASNSAARAIAAATVLGGPSIVATTLCVGRGSRNHSLPRGQAFSAATMRFCSARTPMSSQRQPQAVQTVSAITVSGMAAAVALETRCDTGGTVPLQVKANYHFVGSSIVTHPHANPQGVPTHAMPVDRDGDSRDRHRFAAGRCRAGAQGPDHRWVVFFCFVCVVV